MWGVTPSATVSSRWVLDGEGRGPPLGDTFTGRLAADRAAPDHDPGHDIDHQEAGGVGAERVVGIGGCVIGREQCPPTAVDTEVAIRRW
jgi:hypothetical protein